ncbi:MAG: iron-containing alcohol dehydrogenase [Oscillospiraceae bacterium]|jgi:alcohol dehydrogenase YqhD (iron-dependent ADH family)|nr:iron-containing alcohol dehydrogenase [Oscillospiraceae bacterium]
MLNFTFHLPTKLIFGRDEHRNIGRYIKPYARTILLHYGGGSVKRSGAYDEIAASLDEAGVAFAELGGVAPNPRVELVRQGVELCRKEGVELVLAVGGGSAIDSAKAIAIGVPYAGDVWKLYRERIVTGRALPVATVLTIPAAGSEMSKSSVITNEAEQLKYGHNDDATRPVLSVVNPALFMTLPKEQIAYGVCDMMSHIFERYFTQTPRTDVSDELCEGVLRAVMKNAPKLMADPGDYGAWCEIGWASSLAHNDLLGRGREEDWACHHVEHELSAIYDVAHGAGLAVLTPPWMEIAYKANTPMFLQFARNVMGVAGGRDADEIILEAIARLRRFFRELGLPGSLRELGIGPERLEEMARKATGIAFGEETGQGNFLKLDWRGVLALLERAL